MQKLLVVIVLLCLIQSGCIDKNYELLQTTFKRSFDKEIVASYLNSNDKSKVKAALLSVSHSEDTSFIPLIINLPFEKFPQLICFAIGQIGPCYRSTQFLWGISKTEQITNNSRFIFEAIGKTGSEIDLDKIINMYSRFDGLVFPYSGISLAIRQFAFRGITNHRAVQLLVDEVTNRINPIQNCNDALFTLARTGSSDKINNDLIRYLLLPKTENPDTIKLKQYSLMNFRAQKYFPADDIILKNTLSETNVLLKIEIARALSYRKIVTIKDADLFLNFIRDENPNVSRAAANSVQNLATESDELKNYLIKHFQEMIYSELPPNTLGELLLSLVIVYEFRIDDEVISLFNSGKIPLVYLYDALAAEPEELSYLSILLRDYNDQLSWRPNDWTNQQIHILSGLLKFLVNFPEDERLQKSLLNSLRSEQAPIVSIAADGIDSIFITNNEDEIKAIIPKQLVKEKNNPDFAEGILSLINLAEKIDSNFYDETSVVAMESNVYSVRKYISEKKGLEVVGKKPSEHLNKILDYTFEYKSAEIITDKGNFVIEFLPEYAPVSAGNFCNLAENDYFDNVTFHRVVPGFVIQTGDRTGTGWGGPGYEIISETSQLNYEIGMVGMASSGKDTEGSQWFVMQGNYPHLNGRYSLFARVVSGMDVVYKVDKNDRILDVTLYR